MDILLTDAHQRKTLSALRSLGKKGITQACCESTVMNLSRFSKFCNKFIKIPDCGNDPHVLAEELVRVIKENNIEVFLPMDDLTVRAALLMGEAGAHDEKVNEIPVPQKINAAMQSNRASQKTNDTRMSGLAYQKTNATEQLKQAPQKTNNMKVSESFFVKTALPSAESYSQISDKSKSTYRARQKGINIPETAGRTEEKDEYPDISALSFPLIIKPVNMSGSRGMRVVERREDFPGVYREVNSIYSRPIVQEFVNITNKIDVCLMYDKKHNCVAHFVQEELRNYPHPMGPGTVHKSVNNEELLSLSLEYMEGLDWVGPVELEYGIDALSGKYYFLEVNPRFWASLELAARSGVNFPYLYYLIATDSVLPEFKGYTCGVMTRWSFPGEFLSFFDRNRIAHDTEIIRRKKAERKHMVKKHGDENNRRKDRIPFLFPGRKGIIDDTFQISDPLPAFGLLLSAIYFLADKKRRKFVLRG